MKLGTRREFLWTAAGGILLSGCQRPLELEAVDVSAPPQKEPEKKEPERNEQEMNRSEVKKEKALVIYFSHSGNTRRIAELIQKNTGADLFEVKSVEPYPEDYNTVVEQARKEIDAGFQPAIQKGVENLAEYGVIYFGSPCWWATIAPPLATLLTTGDFAGKTIRPFMTHEGSGMGRSVADIKKYAPDATVQTGLAIFGHAVKSAEPEVKKWLNR
ncbi:MAG: flavodoxin [Planctomycetia bacterium]|nr:flavodoxin [Planctomycetia bacterium]